MNSGIQRQRRLLENQQRYEQQCAARLQQVVRQKDELAMQMQQLQGYRAEYRVGGSSAQQMTDTMVFLDRLDHSILELRHHLSRAEREVENWRQRVQRASARSLALSKLLSKTRDEQRRQSRNSERRTIDERIAAHAARRHSG